MRHARPQPCSTDAAIPKRRGQGTGDRGPCSAPGSLGCQPSRADRRERGPNCALHQRRWVPFLTGSSPGSGAAAPEMGRRRGRELRKPAAAEAGMCLPGRHPPGATAPRGGGGAGGAVGVIHAAHNLRMPLVHPPSRTCSPSSGPGNARGRARRPRSRAGLAGAARPRRGQPPQSA